MNYQCSNASTSKQKISGQRVHDTMEQLVVLTHNGVITATLRHKQVRNEMETV